MRRILFLLTVMAIGAAAVVLFPRPMNAGPAFTAMSYNIGNNQPPHPTTDNVVRIIRSSVTPDILFLQDAAWAVTTKDLAERLGYPYYASSRELSPGSNLGILSRYPLSNPDVMHFEPERDRRPAALCVDGIIGGQSVLLCSAHLPSLSATLRQTDRAGGGRLLTLITIGAGELLADTPRSDSARKLMAWISARHARTTVLGGDFNSFPLSKAVRIITRELDDASWPSRAYFRGTYRAGDFPLQPRIDYLFHSGDLHSLGAGVIRQTAGDHYPVYAAFRLPAQPGAAAVR
jgi:endonuclease/exonuclease/phosphatase family metal-dependent hydrolase